MPAPAHPETFRLSGLEKPVEIRKDSWGVAHIYAETEADLFFAQGWNAASDRLFQLELWRRQATGTLAEITGPRDLPRDIGARLHQYRGSMEEEYQAYHPRARQVIASFVAGINAYIARTERDPSLLTLEFRVLGIKPQPWTPEIVISRHQGRVENGLQESAIGAAVAAAGPDVVRQVWSFDPPDPDLTLDPSIDAELLSADIMKFYNAYRQSVVFLPEDVLPEFRNPEPVSLSQALQFESELANPIDVLGSNNWVVHGSRTASGKPLLGNDPHRVQPVPSLRYIVHLIGPGWNVIGAGEPALPGVSIGHNEYGAWGLTVFYLDSEDLYVYELNPDNPLQYRYGDGWEDMRVVRETIPVKGEEAHTLDLKFTRHGPVLYQDAAGRRAVALRAGWLRPGTAPYLASLRMDQAANWEEFRQACTHNMIPGENMVWADVHGTIGWQAAGIAPVRPNWSGLVPVPGDGRFEWAGFLPVARLPHCVNPPEGAWATANNNVVPADYPHPEVRPWLWSAPYRAERANAVLTSSTGQTVQDMIRLQLDEYSVPASQLVPLLQRIRPENPLEEQARQILLAWDRVLNQDSAGAALYISWERRLSRNVEKRCVPPAIIGLASRYRKISKIIEWVLHPDERWGPHPERARDALVAASLTEAVADLQRRFGSDPADWRYGDPRFKHQKLQHPLSPAVRAELRQQLDVGPTPRGGDANVLNNSGGGDNQTSGASFRLIADTADWDNSVATQNPGQSGNPGSSHYRDLHLPWARGEFFPLLYSREKIEQHTAETVRLEPRTGV